MNLNLRGLRLVESVVNDAEAMRIAVENVEGGGLFIDCGIRVDGGLRAGKMLARICLADLGEVAIESGEVAGRPCPTVRVETDQPVPGCLGSQYAGWKLSSEGFFAMGSGPMRAARLNREKILERTGLAERADRVVGVLETRTVPPREVFEQIAQACGIAPENVTLLAAPTASLAGGVQIAARSVETALHKLAELNFDLSRIVSATGTAPLPPVASNDMKAVGRTNDAILYGARVVLHLKGSDDWIEIGPRVPSSGSKDFGEPFFKIFERASNDFYAIDPMLFSPAEVVFQNLETGRVRSFGKPRPEVLARSFFDKS